MRVPTNIGRSEVGINLTPMIDVVFLLLIFFLVESRFAQEERSMRIELPNASAAVPMTQRPRELVVEIDQQGQLMLDGARTTLAAVEQSLTQAVTDNPSTQSVIVRADRRAPLQAAVTVIDLCSRLGAEHALLLQDKP